MPENDDVESLSTGTKRLAQFAANQQYLNCGVKFPQQLRADLGKRLHYAPANAHRARAADAVTLARHLDVSPQRAPPDAVVVQFDNGRCGRTNAAI